MSTTTTALIVLIVVALIGMLLRRGSSSSSQVSQAPPPPDEPSGSYAYVEDDDASAADGDEDDAIPLAMTSDGWAFVPDGHEVQLVPPRSSEEDITAVLGETTPVHIDRSTGALEEAPRGRALPQMKPGEHLDQGDLAGARVVRGAVGVDPWRLEALGREGEYRAWPFETEDAARAALDLLLQRIVRPPVDEDGTTRTPGDADYATAMAMTEQGVADLATQPDDES